MIHAYSVKADVQVEEQLAGIMLTQRVAVCRKTVP